MPSWTDPKTWSVGAALPAAELNTYVRDNTNSTAHLLAYKSADESVTSSTTLQNDDHLFLAMGANDIWYVSVGVLVNDASSSVADIKIAFTFPSGSLALYTIYSDTGSTIAFHEWRVSGTADSLGVTNVDRFITIAGIATNGATPGNLQMQWAQVVSNAAAVTVKKGSLITGFKLA